MLCLRTLVPLAVMLAAFLLLAHSMAAWANSETTARARQFVARHETRVRPLEIAANLAWWNANTTGKDEDFKKKEEAQNRLDEVLADPKTFQQVKALRESLAEIDDPITARAIQVLYLAYLEKQVDPALLRKIVAKANAIEQAFNVFRAKVDGQEMTDNQVREVLKTSRDSARRQKVWEASKAVGGQIEADLKELVRLRNQAAVKLGFKNYHALQLFLNEQNGEDLLRLFDELDNLTREPFRAAKAEIDARLAADHGITVKELMPWHYYDPFFQESPAVFTANLDAPYAHADLIRLSRDFYAGIGLPVEDVLDHSDLFPKSGKSQHAFCTDINRAGDVRVLANIVPNESWMGTMLHELGHSVYSSKNIPASLPYTLRMEAHILTTEGVAMMFERWSKNRAWMEKMGLKVDDARAFDETAAKMVRNQLLIFSRWCQVMLRFEKSMYEDPDQDLNKLWWDLVEKYQEVRRPPGRTAPDYASKIHIVSAPVYYHNYMMGQLFASQVHHAICREVLHGVDPQRALYVGNPEVGAFMKKRVFEPGRTLPWNALTRYATGEELNARAFAEDFRGK
ncbi:MAG: M2 family metallopeptidase [Planctomycetes bacterium]|nr:M2 family metallopeptidase [Planctomycetota bacterium]